LGLLRFDERGLGTLLFGFDRFFGELAFGNIRSP
jgi:hypothetical protein